MKRSRQQQSSSFYCGSSHENADAANDPSIQQHEHHPNRCCFRSSNNSRRRSSRLRRLPAKAILRRQFPLSCLLMLVLLTTTTTIVDASFGGIPLGLKPEFPSVVNLRAVVMTDTIPLAWYDENYTTTIYDDDMDPILFGDNNAYNQTNQTHVHHQVDVPYPQYRGVQPDLIRQLMIIAKELDNVTLTFDLEEADPPFSYSQQFEYLTNDCGFVANAHTNNRTLTEEECNRYDLAIGDYYGLPTRSIRAPLTPSFLATAGATVQYIYRQKRVITTLQEAQELQEPVCFLKGSHFDTTTLELYPDLVRQQCTSHDECLRLLKDDSCALFVEDQLQLRYFATQDATLTVTRESFQNNMILWPMNARLDPLIQQLLIRWMYQAKVVGVLDELDSNYFSVDTCPLGFAGESCQNPCDPTHGTSDRYGVCICTSTRWTGDDCSIEVMEDKNLINNAMKMISYVMVGINYLAVIICTIWLFWHRNTAQVKVAQPFFLFLILMGCVMSTSTILPLGAQDEGLLGESASNYMNGYGKEELSACMAVPWLYSVGFSLTVGSLFAKIRRVYLLFHGGATMQRVSVTATETFYIVGLILISDVIILTVWTIIDPLYWYREPVTLDKFGHVLESEGSCTSDHLVIFGGLILCFHFTMMGLACYQCYLAREIPTKFSEGKYVTIAMLAQLQIFVVSAPVLIILGTDPETSFFLQTCIIWMNDFVVLVLIFGNLMYSIHGHQFLDNSNRKVLIRQAMSTYQGRRNQRKSKMIGGRSASQYGSGFGSMGFASPSMTMSYGAARPSGAGLSIGTNSNFDASSLMMVTNSNHTASIGPLRTTGTTAPIRESDESESDSSSSTADRFRDEERSAILDISFKAEIEKVDSTGELIENGSSGLLSLEDKGPVEHRGPVGMEARASLIKMSLDSDDLSASESSFAEDPDILQGVEKHPDNSSREFPGNDSKIGIEVSPPLINSSSGDASATSSTTSPQEEIANTDKEIDASMQAHVGMPGGRLSQSLGPGNWGESDAAAVVGGNSTSADAAAAAAAPPSASRRHRNSTGSADMMRRTQQQQQNNKKNSVAQEERPLVSCTTGTTMKETTTTTTHSYCINNSSKEEEDKYFSCSSNDNSHVSTDSTMHSAAAAPRDSNDFYFT